MKKETKRIYRSTVQKRNEKILLKIQKTKERTLSVVSYLVRNEFAHDPIAEMQANFEWMWPRL